MRRLFAVFALSCTLAFAATQVIIKYNNDGTLSQIVSVSLPVPPAAAPGTPVTTMRPNKWYINNVMPARAIGNTILDDSFTASGGSNVPGWGSSPLGVFPGSNATGQVGRNSGDFRLFCATSHFAYDDPIVFPGQPGRSHLHVFFGNTGANGNSTPDSIRTTGNGTCAGGLYNRSSYWVPALINHGGPNDGQIIKPTANNAYYKGFFGAGSYTVGQPSTDWVFNHDVQPFPVNFRMIAGTPSATPSSPDPRDTYWQCRLANFEDGPRYKWIPGTGGTAHCPHDHSATNLWTIEIIMSVPFDSCWNGVDLDSPTHNAHITGPETKTGPNDLGCPTGFDVPMPGITYKVHYSMPATYTDVQYWRLSSDAYADTSPAGYSAHGDWFNGWGTGHLEEIVANCIVSGADCHDHLVAPVPGTSGTVWKQLRNARTDR